MEYITLILTLLIISIIVYRLPFATDNPMGEPIGECKLFIVSEVKKEYIKGSFKTNIKNFGTNKEVLNNYFIELSNVSKTIKLGIKDSYNIIWVKGLDLTQYRQSGITLFNTKGELLK